MPLSAHNKTIFNALNRSDVAETLAKSKRFTNDQRWLSKNNHYLHNAAEKVESDVKRRLISNPRHLAQYISVSTILHCADGWSYLGRAVQSLLRGDPHRARHLAYYAELRAAMSLLASEGIGVFNSCHAIISAPHVATAVTGGGGTHMFVWDSLSHWAQHAKSGVLFASSIKPYGRSLDEWLSPIGGQVTVGAQAHSWFMQWGMDLQQMAADKNARNHSSYRPEGIPIPWSLAASETTKMITDIWKVLEPAPNSAFDLLDRHILRLALESLQKSRTGSLKAAGSRNFSALVKSVVEYQNLPEKVQQMWVEFLLRQTQVEDAPILDLSRTAPNDSAKSAFAIVSRAVLLLRAASGSTSNLFKDAGFTATEIEFWWKEFGPSRGLWNINGAPEDSLDLWSDIKESLDNIAIFNEDHAGGNYSFYNLGNKVGDSLSTLAGFERAMVWSLLPA